MLQLRARTAKSKKKKKKKILQKFTNLGGWNFLVIVHNSLESRPQFVFQGTLKCQVTFSKGLPDMYIKQAWITGQGFLCCSQKLLT